MRRRSVVELFWDLGEPIRGQMTVINDDRYILGYKTRAKLAVSGSASNINRLLRLPQIQAGVRTAQKNTILRV